MCSMVSFLLTYRYIPQEFSKQVANQVFSYFVRPPHKINIFNLILYFFNDNIFISASTHFLLNKLTAESANRIVNFDTSNKILEKFKSIFENQISKIENPKDEFSKLELCFLLVIVLTDPTEKWAQSEQTKRYLIHVFNQATLQNCMTNCFFTISVLKFLIKTLTKIHKLVSKKNVGLLIKNLHYICLYYGLSLDRE